MPWMPPDDYKPRPDLAQYLRSISPRMNTAEFDMVVYWQWVHTGPESDRRTPAQGWRALRMTAQHARDAIDRSIVPLEIYPQAVKRAMEQELLRLAGEPDDYEPMPGLEVFLVTTSPRMNTAEMDMVIYWQWVHRSLVAFRKTPAEAWRDLRMTPQHARDAIDKRIVPLEIYLEVRERAYGKGKPMRAPARRPAPKRALAKRPAAKRRTVRYASSQR